MMDYLSFLPAAVTGTAALYWIAGAVVFLLLIFQGLTAEILTSRRRDFFIRFMRAFLYFLLPALILIPVILLADEHGLALGLGILFYVVFFVLFCYYLGRRIGRAQGRQSISDLVGLDSPDSVEDAQDRLFESRMRYPSRADVVKSIGEMAKAREDEQRNRELRAVGRKAIASQGHTSPDEDIEEVVGIEEEVEIENGNLRP